MNGKNFLIIAVVLMGLIIAMFGLGKLNIGGEASTPIEKQPVASEDLVASEEVPSELPQPPSLLPTTELKLPPAMDPLLSERWLDFLRNQGDAELEEDMVVLHGDYSKALESYKKQLEQCKGSAPDPKWLERAEVALGKDGKLQDFQGVGAAIIYRGMVLRSACVNKKMESAIAKEDELILHFKDVFEMAKTFHEDLEDDDKEEFAVYLKSIKQMAVQTKGPLASQEEMKDQMDPSSVNSFNLNFLESDSAFQKIFDEGQALQQLKDRIQGV